ncbi:MAG: hypothetical protein AMS19_03495 [Gemmatimonas sp. SG8_23]|nr:MAG: hypothetical protein AMS19_03495 [Gemmatimonas sp. SG8_23]
MGMKILRGEGVAWSKRATSRAGDEEMPEAHDDTLSDFEAERTRMIVATKKGIGMPIAGLVYWLAVAVVLRLDLPTRTALVTCFALTGPVFPLGYALTRALGGDLFAKSRTLTPIGLQLAALQLFKATDTRSSPCRWP